MKIVVIAATIFILSASAFLIFKKQTQEPPLQTLPTETTTTESKHEEIDITATFSIKTDAIVRSFKAEKYHNRSLDVFITADNSTMVHVKKMAVTWGNFFQTLPMELTKECLITGDGERLCDGKQGVLRFFVNDIEDKNALETEINKFVSGEIKQNDNLLVTFVFS